MTAEEQARIFEFLRRETVSGGLKWKRLFRGDRTALDEKLAPVYQANHNEVWFIACDKDLRYESERINGLSAFGTGYLEVSTNEGREYIISSAVLGLIKLIEKKIDESNQAVRDTIFRALES